MGKCSVENCENECFKKEDKFILHCHKNEKNGWYTFDTNNKKVWDPEKVKLFWKAIRNSISESQSRIAKFLPIPFNHIIFPKFEGNGLSSNVLGYENSFFEKEGEKKFTQIVNFSDCTFLDCVDFTNIQFEKDIVFSKCILKDEIKFKRQLNIKMSFLECPEIKSLDFSRIIFEQKVEIKDCIIKSCNFENTRFKDFCDFEESTFNAIKFKNTVFEKLVTFQKTKFKEDVDFYYVTFKTHSIFKNTIFEKTVNFENTLFEVDGSFYGISSKEDKIEDIDVGSRETARIIKNSFEQQNNIIEANKFYKLEMKKREEELAKDIKSGKNIVDWLIFKAHAISSNHSQNPILPILWILNIALFYSMSISTFYHNNALASMSAFFIIECFVFCRTRWLKIMLFVNLLILYSLSYIDLDVIADKINPFSIMTSKDPITFWLLIFKITIAYLIYQFIVSVRQNTRRS